MTRGPDVGPLPDSLRPEDVEVRPLTSELIPAATEVHMEAFRGFLSARLGRRYVRVFLKWFDERRDAVALAAVDRNQTILGYVAGMAADDWYLLTRRVMPSAITGVALRPWLVIDPEVRSRFTPWLRALRRPTTAEHTPPHRRDRTMDLVAIAVSPRAQGTGIGARLVHEFEEEAASRGMEVVGLSVRADNIAARRLYERCGWQVVEHSGSPDEVGYRKTLANRGEPRRPSPSGTRSGKTTQ